MSGICEIIDLIGMKPDPNQLRLMIGVLERRVPDGINNYIIMNDF